MSRIRTIIKRATGGASGNVAWGPDFGGTDGDQFQVGASLAMPSLALSHDKTLGAQLTMPSLAFAQSQSAGAHLAGSLSGGPFFQELQQTAATANATSIVITTPTTRQAGDLMVAFVGESSAGADTITPPAGWTQIQHSNSAGTVRVTAGSWYRLVTGSETSTYTWTLSASVAAIGCIMLWRGVDQTTPINVSGNSTGNATDPVSPSITTTAANCAMMSCCAKATALSETYTPPSGYVEQTDQVGTNLSIAQVSGETATRVQASAGASGTKTHDCTALTSAQYICNHIAIAPGTVTLQ